jgi:hypothetical protein
MKIGELKKELEKFDNEAEVFFEIEEKDRYKYPEAKIDMRFFNGDYAGFDLVLIKEAK